MTTTFPVLDPCGEPSTAPIPARRKSWLRQALLSLLRHTIPRRLLVTCGDAHSQEIHLTFDDGPDPVTTPRILDVLRRYQARSTFYVVGERAAAHPELLERMVREGHAIAGHSYWHKPHGEVSARALLEEVRATDAVLKKAVGYRPRAFRPPYGKLTIAKLALLWGCGRQIVLWNRDPRDFAAPSAAALASWFVDQPLRGGDIVLLHDTCVITAEVLEQVLARGQQSGKKFTPLA